MRQIKFRAWLKTELRWLEYGEFYLDALGRVFTTQYSGLGEPHTDITDIVIKVQFTGLHDKNGKEIYEGDCFTDEEDGTTNFVEWDNHFGGWGTNEWFTPEELVREAPTLEITGNIYEN